MIIEYKEIKYKEVLQALQLVCMHLVRWLKKSRVRKEWLPDKILYVLFLAVMQRKGNELGLYLPLLLLPLLIPPDPSIHHSSTVPGTTLPIGSNCFFSELVSAHWAPALSHWECTAVQLLPGEDSRASPLSPTSQVKGDLHTLPHRTKPGWKRKLSLWSFWLNFPIKTKREICPVKEVVIRLWASFQSSLSRQGANRSAVLFPPLLGQGQTDKIHILVQFQITNVPPDEEKRG